MLLPDNIYPELCIYYTGAVIIKELSKKSETNILDLYLDIKKVNNMSFSLFVLSLDWLYLINVVVIDKRGIVTKCL